ncbi:hypothetical protein SNEBB_007541 [Seison nebaliae]|nr:hypothetical protein SNEBB_007541 [Seison nebaliae]
MDDNGDGRRTKSAAVFVLGDLGHSPRMQFHSLSLANTNYHVSLFGYRESQCIEEVESNKNIEQINIKSFPKWMNNFPSFLRFPFKFFWLFITTLFTFITLRRQFDILLVQNPPTLPSLIIGLLLRRLGYTRRFYIDWHNFGYSMFSETSKMMRFIVENIEMRIGRMSDGNFCVSSAMKHRLLTNNINSNVFYDRPLSNRLNIGKDDGTINGMTVTDFRQRLLEQYSINWAKNELLMVSSTSWTVEEDFNILFHALNHFNETKERLVNGLPNVLCIITGKGELKDYYMNEYHRLKSNGSLKHVRIETIWLTTQDYPLLFSFANVGISLHKSTSGYDLPMKIIDMCAAALPESSSQLPTNCIDYSSISSITIGLM